MKKIKEWFIDNKDIMIPFIFLILDIIALVIGSCCIIADYANKPISEVPAWVLWLMFQNR